MPALNPEENIGRIFFALSIAGLGITHFIFQDFMTGRAPAWPENSAGGMLWAYLSGLFFISAGIAVIFGKKARILLVASALLIFLWAFLRHIPVLAGEALLSPTWTNAGKATVLGGGALALAALFPGITDKRIPAALPGFLNMNKGFLITGQICLALFFLITGMQHFIYTDFVASLIPGWFPGDAVFWTNFGGAALIAGGLGLFIPRAAQFAALFSGIMVFSWFWIIHIPRSFYGISDGIAVFEALAVSGIAIGIAGMLRNQRNTNTKPSLK